MNAENNVPAIRFKGFSGEWVSSELGKLLDITSAARVHKNEWTDTGVPFFRTSDVVSIYKGQENKKAYISFELYKELSARSGTVKKDDLLITGGGSIGIPYLITTIDPMYFKDADLLWLKNTTDTNGYLLFTFFSSPPFRKYINSITHIGTISHYTIEQAKTTPIYVSEESEEQTKIGNYFQQLDTLIAQHQQKHNKLLNLKKALLEKMFPKQGATEPEIRFKGFCGEWEDKALKEICTYHTSSLTVSDATIEGKYKLHDANKAIGYTDKNVQNFDYITIIKDGSGVGRVRLLPKKTSFIGTMGAIQAEKSDIHFLYCCLIKIDFSKHISGATIPHVYFSAYGNDNCITPIFEEQTKIGNLFKQLDTLITQHQAQLKKLNNIKQACLEKMFV